MAVFLVACGSPSGVPKPSTSTAAPTAVDSRFGAPIPAAPRDLRGKDRDPCGALLSSNDLQSLDFEPRGRVVALDSDLECTWDGAGRQQSVSVAAYANRDLLVDTYRARLTRIFVPTTVGGLPAVVQRTSDQALSCTITTGVAAGQALETTWYEYRLRNGAPINDPCARARQVVEAVVGNLPPLQ